MITVLTIPDLIWFLLSLFVKLLVAMVRSRHSTLGILVSTCVVTISLTIFLTYRCVQISRLRNPYILEDLSDQSENVYNQLAGTSAQVSLLGHMPPITVHYMWCRKSHFEYKHYLSLLSVAKVLRPDQIIFHYLEMPQKDEKGYFTWFDDIQREMPMLTLKQLVNIQLCSHRFTQGVLKSEDFPNPSGIFMMEDVAMTNMSRSTFYHLTGAHELSKKACSEESEICESSKKKPAQLFLVPSSEPFALHPGEGRAVLECPTIDVFTKSKSFHCLQLSQRLFPVDVWHQNKTFDRFARTIAFNRPEPIFPLVTSGISAPKIAHILKFDGEDTLSPLCYASIQSAFSLGKFQHVFVHGQMDSSRKKHGQEGKNPLWENLARKFSLTHIPTPALDQNTPPREQVLYGMHVLIQYGGVLLTCDTIVQKPFDSLLLYPTVSTVVKTIYRIIHHHIDFSVLVSQPASNYLQSLIPVVKQMVEVGSSRDLGAVAYHVLEQYPSSVHTDPDLVGHLTCQSKNKCLPSEGQLDVRRAYAVKFSWGKGSGSPPKSLQELRELSTPLQSLGLDPAVSAAAHS